MQPDPQIGADDQIADVVPQAEAGSQGDLVEQPLPFQFGSRTLGVERIVKARMLLAPPM